MSAITGIFLRNGQKVDSELIKKINDSLAHRGPDGSRIWHKGSVGMGHQLLFTTPESRQETLPFFDEESNLTITADARIDNRQELSEKLNVTNSCDIPDSYFILKAYQKWGKRCPEKLLGDFAFVIWDERSKKLFCARDHIGVKPFYYFLSENAFYFASEIKALLQLKDIPIKINEKKIADYLMLIFEDREITFYENIFRLPAAHRFEIHPDKHYLKQYWSLDPEFRVILDSDEKYANAFKQLFTESVKCRLRSEFPIGSDLSGGLDSSSISCVTQKFLSKENKTLKTFSLVYPGFSNCDESQFIDIVSKNCQVKSYRVTATNIDPFKEIEDPIWPNDEPTSAPNMHRYFQLCKKVNEKGVKILLSGFDGDSTLGSPGNYFIHLFKKYQLRTFFKEIFAYSNIRDINPCKLIFYNVGSLAPDFLKNIWKFFSKKTYDDYREMNAIKIMEKKFITQNDVLDREKRYESQCEKKSEGLFEWHYYHLISGIFQHELEMFDQFAAACSIEMRYPFFDIRLLQFSLGLPFEQKMKDGQNRIVMRRAMKNILPDEIRWRHSKSISDDVLNEEFIRFGHEKIENMLNNDHVLIDHYINIELLEKLYNESKINLKNGSPFKLVTVMLVYNLNNWLKKFKS